MLTLNEDEHAIIVGETVARFLTHDARGIPAYANFHLDLPDIAKLVLDRALLFVSPCKLRDFLQVVSRRAKESLATELECHVDTIMTIAWGAEITADKAG